jgi:hypothetical protein
VEHLLSGGGIEVDQRDQRGDTALLVAAAKGHIAVIDTLLAHGASVNARNRAGDCSVLVAARGAHWAVLRRLAIVKGAALNVNDTRNQESALHFAARYGDAGVCKLLIQRKADVNSLDVSNYTPLCRAAWREDEGIVSMLLSARATLHTRAGQSGETALMLAIRGEIPSCVEQLVAAGARGVASLSFESSKGQIGAALALRMKLAVGRGQARWAKEQRMALLIGTISHTSPLRIWARDALFDTNTVKEIFAFLGPPVSATAHATLAVSKILLSPSLSSSPSAAPLIARPALLPPVALAGLPTDPSVSVAHLSVRTRRRTEPDATAVSPGEEAGTEAASGERRKRNKKESRKARRKANIDDGAGALAFLQQY